MYNSFDRLTESLVSAPIIIRTLTQNDTEQRVACVMSVFSFFLLTPFSVFKS